MKRFLVSKTDFNEAICKTVVPEITYVGKELISGPIKDFNGKFICCFDIWVNSEYIELYGFNIVKIEKMFLGRWAE